jgi:hypothetical protein
VTKSLAKPTAALGAVRTSVVEVPTESETFL